MLTKSVSNVSGWRYAGYLLLLAAVYGTAVFVVRALSMPPVFASPVWPASGVALVGLLLGGPRLWPAVAVAYFVNHWHYSGFGANAVLLSVGPVLQALAGAWLVRHDAKGIAGSPDTGVLRTMLLAGPVASVIAPTCGIAVLAVQGHITPDALVANWMMWWVGDTLGILLVAPLALVALPAGRRLLGRRVMQVTVPLIGAAVLLLPSMYWFHSNEEADARQPLSLQAELAYDVTRERLQAATKAIIVAARYYALSSNVSSDDFDAFVSETLNDGVLGLSWAPRVPHTDRESFENTVRQDAGFENYRIRERSPSGTWREAAVREEYFPVRYIRTKSGNARTRGFDAASEETRRAAIEEARRTGQPVATAPITLIPAGGRSVLLVVPVYPRGVSPQQLDEATRYDALEGLVVGLLDMPVITAALDGGGEEANIDFRITDTGSNVDDPLVSLRTLAPENAVQLWSREFPLYGRTWHVDSFTSPDYWLAGQSIKSRVFFLATLLSVFLISVHTVTAAVRSRTASLKVATKTRELAESRRRLSAALSISQASVWEVDVANDCLTLDDKAFAQLRTTAKAEGGYRFPAREWVDRFVYPDDADNVLKAYAAAVRQQPDAADIAPEFRIVCADGEVRYLVLHIEMDVNDEGRTTRIFGSTQDVTELKRTELALRESEEYSRSVIEASDDCIAVLSLDGRLVEMAPRGLEMMGIDDFDEVRNRDYIAFWKRAQDQQAARDAVLVAARGGKARFTGNTATFTGAMKWFDVSVTPITGPDGMPVNLLAVSRDITEEYAAKEALSIINADLEQEIERRNVALAASERELRAIFDVAGVGIAHIALDRSMLRVNPKLCEITGFTEDEFLAENHLGRTPEEDRNRELQLIEDIVAGRSKQYVLEKRYVRKDGAEAWLRVTGSVVRDDDDNPLYRVAIIEDISESRAERESRLASERRYRELFDRNPMPMWTYDVENLRFTSVNDAAVRHYGYTRDEFMRMTLRDIRPGDQVAMLDAALDTRSAGYRPSGEMVHRKKDGTPLIAEVTSHDIVNDGRPARLVLANDITERKRADELLAGQKVVLEHIASGASLEESLEVIARLAEKDSPGLACSVLLVDPATGGLRHATAASLPARLVRAIDEGAASGADSFFGVVAGSNDSVLVDDIKASPLWRELRHDEFFNEMLVCWSVPIRDAGGALLGAFVNYHTDPRQPLDTQSRLFDSLTHTATIAIGKDIETRRYRQSQARFRATFEMGGLGIAHVDTNGRILQANAALCHIIGYTEDELRQINPDALIHPDDRDIGANRRRQLWAGELPRYTVDRRYIRKNGSLIWVRITASAVMNDDGTVAYGIALLEDISWRKQAEASLHRQQEINRLLLENLSEGVVALDEDGELMLFNKAARDWHGVDIRGMSAEEQRRHFTLHDADGKSLLDPRDVPIMRAFRGEPVIDQEMTIVRKDKPPRTVLATGAQLRDADGEKRGAVVVLHDVTERRDALRQLEQAADELRAANLAVEHERASLAERVAARTTELTAANEELEQARQAAEAASRAKSAFLAVMSHEIRTPMNGIVGMVEVLGQSTLEREQVDAVNTIRDSSFSLLRIIDDVLDFSKIEAGRLELELVEFDLPELVGNVCDSLVAEAMGKDVDLQMFIEPALPQRVRTDPTRLRQLLYNLIGNAIKFSSGLPDRRGCVEITVLPDADAPGRIAFRVRDNGIGINANVLPELFTSFTQAEASTTRRFGGTGLGLAITKRLVHLMEGEISVASESGKGATFCVSLPLPSVEALPDAIEMSLDGLPCIVVGPGNAATDAMASYAQHAQGKVLRAADEDAALQLAGNDDGPVVIVRQTGERELDPEKIQPSAAGNVRHLVIQPGSRSTARVMAPHVVVMKGSAFRREDYVRAVAVAAGKASPDVTESANDEIVRGQLVVPTVSQARADGRLILVAEDDPINQKVILRQLGLLGYAGEVASNGVEALQMWKDGRYALLLTDLHMPEMDGYALVEALRGLEQDDERMPVLALTANALRGEAERATAAGFDEYLTKPLQLSVLGAVLERWLPDLAAEAGENTADSVVLSDETGQAVDRGVLRSIIGDDPALVHEFLGEYLTSSRALTVELQAAMAGGDLRDIALLAHRQKGAARAIGASRLGDICAELENAARAAELKTVYRLLARFEVSAARVEADVSAMLADAADPGVPPQSAATGT